MRLVPGCVECKHNVSHSQPASIIPRLHPPPPPAAGQLLSQYSAAGEVEPWNEATAPCCKKTVFLCAVKTSGSELLSIGPLQTDGMCVNSPTCQSVCVCVCE